MFGLVIAALIFLYGFASQPEDASLLIPLAATFPFLWYWHITFAIIKVVIAAGLFLVGSFITLANRNDVPVGLGFIAASPIFLLFSGFTSVLFLSGVYYAGVGLAPDGSIASQNSLIVGGVLYAVGVLVQLAGRGASSNSKSDN